MDIDELINNMKYSFVQGDDGRWKEVGTCPECQEVFDKGRLLYHTREMHTNALISCKIEPSCSFKAKKRRHMAAHQLQAHSHPWIKCSEEGCLFKAETSIIMEQHETDQHGYIHFQPLSVPSPCPSPPPIRVNDVRYYDIVPPHLAGNLVHDGPTAHPRNRWVSHGTNSFPARDNGSDGSGSTLSGSSTTGPLRMTPNNLFTGPFRQPSNQVAVIYRSTSALLPPVFGNLGVGSQPGSTSQ